MVTEQLGDGKAALRMAPLFQTHAGKTRVMEQLGNRKDVLKVAACHELERHSLRGHLPRVQAPLISGTRHLPRVSRASVN